MKGLRFSAKELGLKPRKDSGTGTLAGLLSQKRKISESGMNKTEELFSHLLEASKKAGEIADWQFEAVTLKVAPNTRYKPDFLAVLPCGHWQFFEIKGHLRDDAAVKFKTAAQRYPSASFMMLRRRKGAWETIYNLPSPSRPNGKPTPKALTAPKKRGKKIQGKPPKL